ncbi:MAG: hypothetical protein AB1546_01690, partial [bacterium]
RIYLYYAAYEYQLNDVYTIVGEVTYESGESKPCNALLGFIMPAGEHIISSFGISFPLNDATSHRWGITAAVTLSM